MGWKQPNSQWLSQNAYCLFTACLLANPQTLTEANIMLLFSFYVLWPNTHSLPGYIARLHKNVTFKICFQKMDATLKRRMWYLDNRSLHHKMWHKSMLCSMDHSFCRYQSSLNVMRHSQTVWFTGFCFLVPRECSQNWMQERQLSLGETGGEKDL